MTKKEFKDWLERSPGISKWGYNKLSDKTGLPLKTVKEIVKDYRQIYMVSTKHKITSEIKELNKQVTFKHEFQNVNSLTGHYNVPGMHIMFPCVHVPYENHDLMLSALKLMKTFQKDIKGFHILGDFLDMNPLSSHDKGNISSNTLDVEYEMGNLLLDDIENVLPKNILKTYIWGNHEDRYKRYMKNVDNAKLGTALQSPTVALRLHERNYKVFEDWKNSYITVGNHLTLSHGEFCNVHTAKKHLDTYRKSVIYGHTHRKQVYIEGDNGAYNIGFMGDINSPAFNYATRAMKQSWVNSFAVVTIDNEGYFNVEIPTWYNNKLVFGGKTY